MSAEWMMDSMPKFCNEKRLELNIYTFALVATMVRY